MLVFAIVGSLLAAIASHDRDDVSPASPDSVEPWTSLAVDVATDGASRLRLLPGLGVVRTRALLDDREKRGPVSTLDDLRRIRGFGPKTVAALRTAGAVAGPADARLAGRATPAPAPGTGAPPLPASVPVGLGPPQRPAEDAR